MSQKDVAQKAGISQAALSQMERIDNEHRTATLVKLAKAMGGVRGSVEGLMAFQERESLRSMWKGMVPGFISPPQ